MNNAHQKNISEVQCSSNNIDDNKQETTNTSYKRPKTFKEHLERLLELSNNMKNIKTLLRGLEYYENEIATVYKKYLSLQISEKKMSNYIYILHEHLLLAFPKIPCTALYIKPSVEGQSIRIKKEYAQEFNIYTNKKGEGIMLPKRKTIK